MAEYKRAAGIADPAAGEEEIDYVLYDTQTSGTTAGAAITFFDQSEASAGIKATNMPIANQLPSSQRFSINSIQVLFDPEMATGDLKDILDQAVLEIKINEKRKFIAPLAWFTSQGQLIPSTTWGGATVSDLPQMGGSVYTLTNPIALQGGTTLSVKIQIGQTAPSASSYIQVLLCGLLIRPAG